MPLVALLAPMGGPVLEGKHLYARMCIEGCTRARCFELSCGDLCSYRSSVFSTVFLLWVLVQIHRGCGNGFAADSMPMGDFGVLQTSEVCAFISCEQTRTCKD